MQIIKHAFEVVEQVRKDGDFSGVVVKIPSTGVAADELKVIDHKLGRIPVGCQIILKDADCDVYVISSNENTITIRFTVERVNVNLRIW